MNNKELNIDTFGAIMDDFIKDADIQLVIGMPKGTTKPTLFDNTFNAPVIQLCILMNAIGPTIKKIWETTDKDGEPMFRPDTMEEFIDEVLKLIKADIMESAEK